MGFRRSISAWTGALIGAMVWATASAQVVWNNTGAIPAGQDAVLRYTDVVAGKPILGGQEFMALGTAPIDASTLGVKFASSTDGGATWTYAGAFAIPDGTIGGAGDDVFQMAYGPAGYVVINRSSFCWPNGGDGAPPDLCAWRLDDLAGWVPLAIETGLSQFYAIAASSSSYLILGREGEGPCFSQGEPDARTRCTVTRSTDTTDWADGLQNTEMNPLTDAARGHLVHAGGRFLFDGYDGQSTTSASERIWRSADGIVWQSAASALPGAAPCVLRHGIAYGAGHYHAFSLTPAKACISSTGAAWSLVDVEGPFLGTTSKELLFFDGAFQSRYQSGVTPFSRSGQAWNMATHEFTEALAMASDGDRAVQVGLAATGFLYAVSDRIFASGFESE